MKRRERIRATPNDPIDAEKVTASVERSAGAATGSATLTSRSSGPAPSVRAAAVQLPREAAERRLESHHRPRNFEV